MFFIIVFGVWTLMHVYVAQRLLSSVPSKTKQVRYCITALFVFMWPSLFLSRLFELWAPPAVARVLDVASSDWLGILFLVFITLLAVDVVTAFGVLLKSIVIPARRIALAAGLLLSVVALVQGMRAPTVQQYEVKVAQLPRDLDGTTVVLASDFHVGTVLGKEWLASRVGEIQQLHPELVILAGDMVEGHGVPAEGIAAEFGKLSAPLGVWAVNGNHERYGATTSLLAGVGIHVLKDEWKDVRPGLVIAGVDDLSEHNRGTASPAERVRKSLTGIKEGSSVLYVSHSPALPEIAAEMHAGLMVSGHTHNGQIWPFNYVVKMVFPKIHGQYEVNGMPLIVCGGTGTWGPRMRLWSRGEIVRIVLRSPSI